MINQSILLEQTNPENSRRISIELPNKLIDRFDNLKREWGLRRRGAVIERLLNLVLAEDTEVENIKNDEPLLDINVEEISNNNNTNNNLYNETTALVLIKDKQNKNSENHPLIEDNYSNIQKSKEINLPGFVSKKSEQLRTSLGKSRRNIKYDEPFISSIKEVDINKALEAASHHWLSLYGQSPGETVIEAAMTWLALDIWPQLEVTENLPFTWNASNQLIKKYFSAWKIEKPNFERIMVITGVLEDPFATDSLSQRMPSLIRRFVNKFKRSNSVTSFQTLESTMTVHGALKILDLPTHAGASLTLNKIRDSYKNKALLAHPDAGGSSESMRKLNEAYQLLKGLYKNNMN